VREVEAAGFRGAINHYIGMSHYPALGADGQVDPDQGMNDAALAWHRGLANSARDRGYGLVWSLSYELLDSICPPEWKQRDHQGNAARPGYVPPSSLVSPANVDAIGYLGSIGVELAGLSVEAGLEPMFQVGEPWWWVQSDGAICCYDEAAKAALGGSPVAIPDVRGTLNPPQLALLDQAGELLAQSTASIVAAVKAAVPATRSHLLVYLPALLDPRAPEVRRANLPTGWALPAFDRLQLEDYEWVTGERRSLREAAYELVADRLGYPPGLQHYLSGFAETQEQWRAIVAAAREAAGRGVSDIFLWAMPQWWRDNAVIFGEDEVAPFDDVEFPIAVGAEASVAPGFSTNIVTSASGHEFRNANWCQARLRFDAGPGVRSEQDLGRLIAFFRARRGSAVAFRFRDPFDHSSNRMSDAPTALDQRLGEGDGTVCAFPLVKHYGEGEERRITRPVAGTVRVGLDGTELQSGWVLDPLGVVRFEDPPPAGAKVAAGYLFDVPVRFEEDRIELNRATFLAGEAPSVPLIEVREE
jgi:uncharacterized protein (TIGR02217 family)